jgi:hypothetical protein
VRAPRAHGGGAASKRAATPGRAASRAAAQGRSSSAVAAARAVQVQATVRKEGGKGGW